MPRAGSTRRRYPPDGQPGGGHQQRDPEGDLDHVLHRGSAPERARQEHADEGGRHRADAEPPDERRVHRAPAQVDDGADRLHHRAGDQVAGDGGERVDAEEQHEDGRHQGAAAHAGEPDDDADAESGERQEEVEVHQATLAYRIDGQ